MTSPPQNPTNQPISDFPEKQTLEELLPESKYIKELKRGKSWDADLPWLKLELILPYGFNDEDKLKELLIQNQLTIDNIWTNKYALLKKKGVDGKEGAAYSGASDTMQYKIMIRKELLKKGKNEMDEQVMKLTLTANIIKTGAKVVELIPAVRAINEYISSFENRNKGAYQNGKDQAQADNPEKQTLEELLPSAQYITHWSKQKLAINTDIALHLLLSAQFKEEGKLKELLCKYKLPIDTIKGKGLGSSEDKTYSGKSDAISYKIRLRTEKIKTRQDPIMPAIRGCLACGCYKPGCVECDAYKENYDYKHDVVGEEKISRIIIDANAPKGKAEESLGRLMRAIKEYITLYENTPAPIPATR